MLELILIILVMAHDIMVSTMINLETLSHGIILYCIDSTQGTASNRVKVYVNGICTSNEIADDVHYSKL